MNFYYLNRMLLRCSPHRRLHSASRLQKFVITLSNVSLEIALIWLVIDVSRAAISLGLSTYTLLFRWLHKKKSGGVKSVLCGGQAKSQFREINLLGNFCCSFVKTSPRMCAVAPSC
ncbi:hypothetical protein PGB90_002282 [Kerria lacca]